MRSFNTAGPVKPDRDYCIPPLDRLDLDEVLFLIGQAKYFVLHAPRQSGKTSTLLALRDRLNADGAYHCVYTTFECAQTARENVEEAMQAILDELAERARRTLGDHLISDAWPDILAKSGPYRALAVSLTRWAEAAPKPLVLLIDEIDALVGRSLISALRQLRAGHDKRPDRFPQSVVLCGLRDVRNYPIDAGGSPFYVKAESLRLDDFARDEVQALLEQHTAETGQAFSPEALEAIWSQTMGQPWLVNAFAYETCFRNKLLREHSRRIEAADIMDARERLILRHETHLDQLADKLSQERVRRVIEPLLSSGDRLKGTARDLNYVQELGLIARDPPLRIANPVYAELIPRELTSAIQVGLVQEQAWYVDTGGMLDLPKLMAAFQAFFRQHSEHWIEGLEYKEAGPQLLLQAFLQRIVKRGGRVEREYGLGRGRTDVLISWPQGESTRKFVIECRLRRNGLDQTIGESVEQTAGYMTRCAAEAGHLVIFDRDEGRSWDEKVFRRRVRAESGAEIEVWGM